MALVCNDMHTDEQFLQLTVGFGLGLVFVFRFNILCFCVVFVLPAFVVLGLVSSVLHQEIGWEERLRNDVFCVELDIKS